MTITVISQIQHRRGIRSDLPDQLAEGELGFCLDTRQVFIGNSDGFGYNTEILTEFSQGTVPFYGATPSTVAASSTVYLGPVGADTNNQASGFILPFDGQIKSLTVKPHDAPGASLAYTYTLYQNGLVTSTTGNVVGTSANAITIQSNVYVKTGDILSLQLITDPGTTATKHTYSFLLKH